MVYGLVLAPAVWAQPAPPQYTVVVLAIGNTTSSQAYGINTSGQVVGSAQVGGSGYWCVSCGSLGRRHA